MKKSILATALALVMLVGLLPISVLAGWRVEDKSVKMEIPQGEEACLSPSRSEPGAEGACSYALREDRGSQAIDSGEWTMSGWEEVYSGGKAMLQNSFDRAGTCFYTQKINGYDGVDLRWDIAFRQDGTAGTAAIFTLRRNSAQQTYFDIRASKTAGGVLLEARFLNGQAEPITLVPLQKVETANGDALQLRLRRMEGRDGVTLTVLDSQGAELLSQKTSNAAFAGKKFWDNSDLEFICVSYDDYGQYALTGFAHSSCPDDGSEDVRAAADDWSMNVNWLDASDHDHVAVETKSANAGPLFYRETIKKDTGFQLDFDFAAVTKAAAVGAVADVTLQAPALEEQKYIRMILTAREDGGAWVDVNLNNNGSWVPLDSSNVIADTGDDFHVRLTRRTGSNSLTLTISNRAGVVCYAKTFSNAACTDANFFSQTHLQPLVTTHEGAYGTFRISDFTLSDYTGGGGQPVGEEGWRLQQNWSSTEDNTLKNTVANTASFAEWKQLIPTDQEMRMGFLFTPETYSAGGAVTAAVTVRPTTDQTKYMQLKVTHRSGDQHAYLEVCTGTKLVAVLDIANVPGAYYVGVEYLDGTDAMVVTIREKDTKKVLGASYITAQLPIENDVLSSTFASGATQLQALVTTLGDYGMFSISDFTLDGAASAVGRWTMDTGWADASEGGDVDIETTAESFSPNFYRRKLTVDKSFRVGFLFDPKTYNAGGSAVADMTLRLTVNNGVYLRTIITGNSDGSGQVDVNLMNNVWTALHSSGRVSGLGERFWVYLDHKAGSDALTLILAREDGTVVHQASFTNAACTHQNFFHVSDLEALFACVGDYGTFRISSFQVTEPKRAQGWTMPEGWADVTGSGPDSVSNITQSAGSNLRSAQLDGQNGLRLRYHYAANSLQRAENTSAEVILRLANAHDTYLRMVPSLRGETGYQFDLEYYVGGAFQDAVRVAYAEDARIAGGGYDVLLEHQEGSDSLTLELKTAEGETLCRHSLSGEKLTDPAFFNKAMLEFLVNGIDHGTFTISDFAEADDPAQSVSSENWTMGKGWNAYQGAGESVYLAKEDIAESEAVYRLPINGINGFQIAYDLVFDTVVNPATTSYFKLRFDNDPESYLMVRVKGSDRKLRVEPQFYNAETDVWTDFTTQDWTAVGEAATIHVERQGLSDRIRLYVTARGSDTPLIDLSLSAPDVMTDSFLDYLKLQWIFGADGDNATTFKIYNFQVDSFEAEPVCVQSVQVVEEHGLTELQAGEIYRFRSVMAPENATVKAYQWYVDGEAVPGTTSPILNYRFNQDGSHTIRLVVTDRCDQPHTREGALTLTVTKEHPLGDVDGNDTVDRADAELLAGYLVGAVTLDRSQLERADVDRDGRVDSLDVYWILKAAATAE